MLLAAASAVEILIALLSPTDAQQAALNSDISWMAELKDFCANVLGYPIKSKSQKWQMLSAELWRYILFSEFTNDLPGQLPPSLREVPHTAKACDESVRAVCKNLRDSERHHVRYMEQAAAELKLEQAMQGVDDHRSSSAGSQRACVS